MMIVGSNCHGISNESDVEQYNKIVTVKVFLDLMLRKYFYPHFIDGGVYACGYNYHNLHVLLTTRSTEPVKFTNSGT